MYHANHYVSPSVSLSSPVPVRLPVQFLHVFLSMLCSWKNSFLSSSFWLYRPQLLFPANSSQPCLLFEVDLETQTVWLPLTSCSGLSLLFFCQTRISHSLSPRRLLRNPSNPAIFFSICVFLSRQFWTSAVALAAFQQPQGQFFYFFIVASEPHCVACGAEAHRMKQLPGASCEEESCGMLTWQG